MTQHTPFQSVTQSDDLRTLQVIGPKQSEFPGFAIAESSTPPTKRSRGRPSGPRGFVFFTHAQRATSCFRRAHVLWQSAVTSGRYAHQHRRCDGPRCVVGRLRAAEGRVYLHNALALLLAGCLLTKGGAL